jgi:hypothetical protein
MSINLIKMALRFYSGDMTVGSLLEGASLGIIAMAGVMIAYVWLQLASQELFKFIYERVG